VGGVGRHDSMLMYYLLYTVVKRERWQFVDRGAAATLVNRQDQQGMNSPLGRKLSDRPESPSALTRRLLASPEKCSDVGEAPPPLPLALIARLCVVGFLVNCQPSEPFLTRYLIEEKV